jgi:soluble lytic murein transglycosylase-like protein
MNENELIKLAKAVAGTFNLDPSLVCAICEQESSWNPGATRFEPAFYARYEANLDLDDLEKRDRSTSWGLMQIMGETARSIGFNMNMNFLLTPESNLAWGCRFLETRLQHAHYDTEKALLLWNGGGNLEYPTQVLARVSKYNDAISA